MSKQRIPGERSEKAKLKWQGGTLSYRGGTLPTAGVLALLDCCGERWSIDVLQVLMYLVDLCNALEQIEEVLAARALESVANELGLVWEPDHIDSLIELCAIGYGRGGALAAVNALAEWTTGKVVS